MSLNRNKTEFVPKNADSFEDGFCKMTVPVSSLVSGKSFSDVSSSFIHVHTAFDTSSDECRVYCDGVLMATSSLVDVFGSPKYLPPNLPTFIKPLDSDVSSFYYSAGTVDQHGTDLFSNGPKNNTYFTPWILGGGWTDGNPIDVTTSSGGFMGNGHGWNSGLGGHIGSVKFYNKPLTNSEVLQNYKAQKGFFKNINL